MISTIDPTIPVAGTPAHSGAPLRGNFLAAYNDINALAAQIPALGNVTSTGSTTPRTLADRFADVINVLDYGADRTGVADSSPAFTAAINQAMATHTAGAPKIVYIPGGSYLLNTPPPLMTKPVALIGDGASKTTIRLATTFVGDCFSFSEVWYNVTYPQDASTIINVAGSTIGARIEGMTIYGNRTAAGVQNGIVFYDHCDEIILRDIDIMYLHGRALYFGAHGTVANSYTRESLLQNVRVSMCGAAGVPSVEITCTGTGDTSNNLQFYNLVVFASYDVGVKIWSQNTAVGDIGNCKFYGMRVEGAAPTNPGVVGHLIEIGSLTGASGVRNCEFYALQCTASILGYYSVAFLAASAATQPLAISMQGLITTGYGGGIYIAAGRGLTFKFTDLHTNQTDVKVGPSTLVSPSIIFDVNALETSLVWDIDPTSAANVFTIPHQEVATNGQNLLIREKSELVTIAAAAATATTMILPFGAIILAVPVRVVTAIPTAATFTVTCTAPARTFNTVAVPVAAGSTDAGTAAGSVYNGTNQVVIITPNVPPLAATGQVRVTMYYIAITPATS